MTTSLGLLNSARGELGQAEERFQPATRDKRGAKFSEIWILRGKNLMRMEQFDAACSCYERAIELSGSALDGYLRLGSVRRAQRRYSDAIQMFQKAIALEPQNQEARNSLNSLSGVLEAIAFVQSLTGEAQGEQGIA